MQVPSPAASLLSITLAALPSINPRTCRLDAAISAVHRAGQRERVSERECDCVRVIV